MGDMGSELKSNYTVHGRRGEARLRGWRALNKVYGTYVLVGEATARLAQDAYVFREVDRVRVKGRAEPMRVHELLGRQGEITPRMQEQLALYEQALTAYHQRRFDEALALFSARRGGVPGHRGRRVRGALPHASSSAPPPEDWDGVFALATRAPPTRREAQSSRRRPAGRRARDGLVLRDVLGHHAAHLLRRHARVVHLARPAHELVVLGGQRVALAARVLADDDVGPHVAEAVAAAAVQLAARLQAARGQLLARRGGHGVRAVGLAARALAHRQAVALHRVPTLRICEVAEERAASPAWPAETAVGPPVRTAAEAAREAGGGPVEPAGCAGRLLEELRHLDGALLRDDRAAGARGAGVASPWPPCRARGAAS